MTTVNKNFKIGDFVRVDKDVICDSTDYEFMMQYTGQNLFIIDEKEIDPALWHYTCKDENGNIIMFNAYNKNPVPFAFIDADLEKLNLVATEPVVGKKVYLGCDFEDSEKVNNFVDANQGKAFEILEVGEYTSKLKDVPYRVPNGNIYELQKLEIPKEQEKQKMQLLQIYDEDGEELGLVQTDMTDEELKQTVTKIDPEDEFGMDYFEKFEEYADKLNKQCTRFYIDGTVNL